MMHTPSTARDLWLTALQKPLRLAGASLPNRLMMSPLTLQYGEDGLLSDRHIAFYRARARGGVGLIFSEQVDASPISRSPFAHSLSALDPRQIERFRALSTALRPFDSRFFVQLFSAGAAGGSTVGMSNWSALRAPSRIPAPGGEPPNPLSVREISQLVSDYARSARNVREGKLHGVEIHGAHGWLIGQFLSPFYNKRQDSYGGAVENRCRLAVEVGRAIRSEVGEDFPVGLALTYDELMGKEGITEEDTLKQLRFLDRQRIFNFFNLTIGSSHQMHHTIASMAVAEGFTLAFAARAKEFLRPETAVLTSGRIVDVLQAGRAVAEGRADVVGMSRALLADPHLLAKALEPGRRERTRCVGANYCVARALVDQPVACVLNPATGRELQWPAISRAERPLSVTVVGAGPAGLRYAMIAAAAGHNVTVLERREKPGGHIALLARLPSREAWNRAIEDWLEALELHGGRLMLGTAVTPDVMEALNPDRVVVATGSRWSIPAYEQPQEIRILSLESAIDALNDAAAFGQHTVIVDSTGTYAPFGLADALTLRGIRVTMLTPNASLGHIAAMELDLQHVMPRLAQRAVEVIVGHRLVQPRGRQLVVGSVWGGETREIAGVDCVVFADARISDDTAFQQLKVRYPHAHLIGDARSPRTTAAVIHEAESLALTL